MAVLMLAGIIVLNARTTSACSHDEACCGKPEPGISANLPKPLVCKLSSKEVEERKAGIITELKKEMIERKELPNGYAFKFKGDDASIDRLIAFVKSERQCCGFFNYSVSITEEYALLELTGPEGAKDFVTEEMGL
jgi:hypothetical protein